MPELTYRDLVQGLTAAVATLAPKRPEKMLRLDEVLERAGHVSETTLRHMITRGEFPKPRRMSLRAVGWREADVDAWVSSRPVVEWDEAAK